MLGPSCGVCGFQDVGLLLPLVFLRCRRLQRFELICGQSASRVLNPIAVSINSGCNIKLKLGDASIRGSPLPVPTPPGTCLETGGLQCMQKPMIEMLLEDS